MTVDMLNSIYPDNKEAQKNCMELAIIVRDSMIQHKEKGLDPNHLVSISTTLYKKHKDFITTRIKELKLTQEEYIRSLILQDLGKRFGLNPYDEAASVKAAKKMKRIK